jgi:hypothetical protein
MEIDGALKTALNQKERERKIDAIKNGTVEVRFVFDREDVKKLCELIEKFTTDLTALVTAAKQVAYDIHAAEFVLQRNTTLQQAIHEAKEVE